MPDRRHSFHQLLLFEFIVANTQTPNDEDEDCGNRLQRTNSTPHKMLSVAAKNIWSSVELLGFRRTQTVEDHSTKGEIRPIQFMMLIAFPLSLPSAVRANVDPSFVAQIRKRSRNGPFNDDSARPCNPFPSMASSAKNNRRALLRRQRQPSVI